MARLVYGPARSFDASRLVKHTSVGFFFPLNISVLDHAEALFLVPWLWQWHSAILHIVRLWFFLVAGSAVLLFVFLLRC